MFPDNTECYIEEDDWEDIQNYLRNGGEIGIEKIPTIRFLRYRDISPVLKEAVAIIASEFADLNKDLKQPGMLERPYLLSRAGSERWEKTMKVVDETLYVRPEPN